MSGKWGVVGKQWTKEFIRNAFNRGYGQPLATGSYVSYWEKTSRVSYYARRFDFDWMKVLAMRVDAARTPLNILRRQIWLARFEYWFRKMGTIRPMYRAAKVEWAYIKERLAQPMTWTGRDLGMATFWAVQIAAGFVFGEMLSRRDEFGYDVGVAVSWAPARPQFAPGFFHVHGIFDDYPFEKSQNMLTRKFQRGYWPNSDENYFYVGRQAHTAPLVPCF